MIHTTPWGRCEETWTGDTGGCLGAGGLKIGRPSESITGETTLPFQWPPNKQRQMSDEDAIKWDGAI
jgi:hypothetical protein